LSGRTHVFSVVPGNGVWERVNNGSAWPSSDPILPTATADVRALGVARAGDQLFLSVARSGRGIETYRGAGQGWTLDRADATSANVLDVFTVGEPNGTLHVGTVPEVS
jgi:hypothetical protein